MPAVCSHQPGHQQLCTVWKRRALIDHIQERVDDYICCAFRLTFLAGANKTAIMAGQLVARLFTVPAVSGSWQAWLTHARVTCAQVDFLPTAAMTPEELEKQRAALALLAKATRVVDFDLDGETAQVRCSSLP